MVDTLIDLIRAYMDTEGLDLKEAEKQIRIDLIDAVHIIAEEEAREGRIK